MLLFTYLSGAGSAIAVVMTVVAHAASTMAVEPGIALDSLQPARIIMSEAEMAHWLATTDAHLTFIGDPSAAPNALTSRSAQRTVLTYCTKRNGSVCGGDCTVYNGSAACIFAPHTQCLAATRDVGFCDRKECVGVCSTLSQCGTWLEGGFCFTPGTKSILVSIL
ncbi:hypothetical protein PYCCODRAFT_1414805 [Trametes coccinea BRFM310]|uniref:Uncharacterized protein n=1 Tax=Trametes coccinea (strain BRFM310) TaxID=1353009 RepID=A0A1Y2II10_TRAC3|nr:hypothetical protein PYCCODRAFT_1414805 [Trametes coccinea BRFM310]